MKTRQKGPKRAGQKRKSKRSLSSSDGGKPSASGDQALSNPPHQIDSSGGESQSNSGLQQTKGNIGTPTPTQTTKRRPLEQAQSSQSERQRRRRMRETIHMRHQRLQLDVNGLRAVVRDLQLQRHMYETKRLVQRHVQLGSYSKIVEEYLRVFRHGVPLADPLIDFTQDCAQWGRRILSSKVCARQRHFANKYMDAELRYGDSIGTYVFLTQWARYSASHRRLKLVPIQLEVVGDEDSAVVVVTAKITAYMTRTTIEMMYPHILSQEEMCQKLLGYFIEYPVRISLEFAGDGRIVQYSADMDIVAPLLHVLGRLDDVVTVCKGALVRNSCLIGNKCQIEVEQEMRSRCRPSYGGASSKAGAPVPAQSPGQVEQQPQQEEEEEQEGEGDAQEKDAKAKMDLEFICC